MPRWPIVLGSIAWLGCGARTELSTSASTGACNSWTAAGSATVVSEPEDVGADVIFTSMIPSAGGALLTWYTVTDAPTSTWNTRALNFDATPRSVITPDLSFPIAGSFFLGSMSLAANGDAFRGLVNDPVHGCRFLPLGQNGAETGLPVSLGGSLSGSPGSIACYELAAAGDGFSFLTSLPSNTGPVPIMLQSIGLDGDLHASKSLGAPPSSSVSLFSGDRHVLRDQSFLLVTSSAMNGILGPQQIQHFAADGTPLANALTRPDSQPIRAMAQTKTGVLAEWSGPNPAVSSGTSIFVQTLDDDGSPTASPTPVAGPVDTDLVLAHPLEIPSGALAPAPNGDVVLGWFEPDQDSMYHLFVMGLGPDGSPRGPATALGVLPLAVLDSVDILVAPDGRRALFVITGSQDQLTRRVLAMPLVCAP